MADITNVQDLDKFLAAPLSDKSKPKGLTPPPQAPQTDPYAESLGGVTQKFPRLKKYVSNVKVQRGRNTKDTERQLEFYPPWESENPNPGNITIEMYRDFSGNEATNAIAGDMLHYLGARNPQTGEPIDPKFWQMKQEVLKARSPGQQNLDRRMYDDEVKKGEKRSYDEWLQQSRIDAYIRGWVTPDKVDEWRKHGFYKSPSMQQAVEKIDKYLKSATDPLPEIKSVQDLDSFLKQPLAQYDTGKIDRWKAAQTAPGPALTRGKEPDLFDRLGDIKVAGDFTLRDAYRRFQLGSQGDVNDPRERWEREHVKQPLSVTSFMEGLGGGVGDMINGLTTPENMALLLGMAVAAPVRAVQMLVDAGFSAQMAKAAYDEYKAGKDALDSGDGEAAVRYWTGSASSLLFAFLSGKGTVHEGEVLHRATRLRDYQLGRLDEISQAKYKKPWSQLNKFEQAEITYGLSNSHGAPISAATAQKHGVQLKGDEPMPGYEKAREIAQQQATALRTARARDANIRPVRMESPPEQPRGRSTFLANQAGRPFLYTDGGEAAEGMTYQSGMALEALAYQPIHPDDVPSWAKPGKHGEFVLEVVKPGDRNTWPKVIIGTIDESAPRANHTPPDVGAVQKQPFREPPDYYQINAPVLSADEREAKQYSLEEARRHLDSERQAQEQEESRIKAEDTARDREARDRREQFTGEQQYRRQRTGLELVVTERRGLAYDTEGAAANRVEYERITGEMDRIAEEHMYTDIPDMIRSIETEKARGRKIDDWKNNIVKLEAQRRDVLRRTDPRALEPKRTDVMRGAAENINLSDREANMRDAAAKLREEAKTKTTPEEFEHVRAEADEAQKRAEELQTRRDVAMAARAAQVADRQIFPTNVPIDLTMGASTEVILPDGRRLPAHYAIAYGDQLVTSHNPLTFQWNDDYQPREAQPRDYSTNDEAQAGVITRGQRYEPERVHSDDPSPHNGPPIIRRDGLVLGGNGREMGRQRAYRMGNADTVHRHLRSKLSQFGLDDLPELERKPSLVRVLDEDPETFEDLYRLGRDLNRTETMGFDPAEQAVTAGRAMSMDMLDWGAAQMDALGEDATLRDFMRARGQQIIERMVSSGMIEPTKRAAYITRDGEMTEAAKDLFEAAWLGKIVDDPELLKTTPKDVLRKLTRGVIGLVKAKAAGGLWDISPEVKGALRLWKRVNSARDGLNEIGDKSDSLVDRYLHPDQYENGSMLIDYGAGTAREMPHPAAEAIAKLLEESQIDVRDGFTDYGNDAEGRQATLGPPLEPVDSFNRSIGSKVDIEVAPEQWATGEPGIRPEVEPSAPVMEEAPTATVQAPPDLGARETLEPVPAVPAAPPSAAPVPPSSVTPERLTEFLQNHPGVGQMAKPLMDNMAVVVQNATGMPMEQFLKAHWADVTDSREVGGGALSQNTEALKAWLGRGKRFSVQPYGEQLSLLAEPEKTYLIVNEKNQSAMVLESELQSLAKENPKLAKAVSFLQGQGMPVDLGGGSAMEKPPEPQGVQGGLFDEQFEEGTLFADLDKGPKMLFQSDTDHFRNAMESLFPGKTFLDLTKEEQSKVVDEAQRRKEADPDKKVLFQEQNPVWQAKSLAILDDGKLANVQSGEQWGALLRNRGIKNDEMKWLGIDDFLKGKKKVDRQELVDFIRENQIQVTEVAKTDTPDDERILGLETARNQLIIELEDQGASLDRVENGYDVHYGDEGGWLKADDQLGYNRQIEQNHARMIRQILDLDNQISELNHGLTGSSKTKYSQYTLPGEKKNYTELLLTLPSRFPETADPYEARRRRIEEGAREFTSSHFDEPNILAHVRFDERTDAEGRRVLFIEEVQSDWHQKGKKQGYKPSPEELKKQDEEREDAYRTLAKLVEKDDLGGYDSHSQAMSGVLAATRGEEFNEWSPETLAAARKYGELRLRAEQEAGTVPNAPFKADWHELAMKRMLRWAAEHDYDRIGWVTGEQTAERYDLSKRTGRIHYSPGDLLIFDEAGRNIVKHISVTDDKLADYVGKEIAQRLLDSPVMPGTTYHALVGDGLKVGGEWAKNLYDKAIPNFLSKYGKKWGARVGETELMGDRSKVSQLNPGDEPTNVRVTPNARGEGFVVRFEINDGRVFVAHHVDERGQALLTREQAEAYSQRITGLQPARDRVHALDVTDDMKRSVMSGQPLFQAADSMKKGATEFLADGRAIVHMFENADSSTFLHEFFHTMRRYLKQQDIRVLEDWLKIKDGKWSRDHEEKAARAWEYYHRQRETKGLPEAVRGVFQKIQDVMRQIYAALKGSPLVKPSSEVSALFDRWYGVEEGGMEPPPETPPETHWRVGGVVDENARADQIGKFITYDKDKVVLEFPDGKREKFTPHQLFPAAEPVTTKREKIEPSAKLEAPPLSPAEREGAELEAEGGRKTLDTGLVRSKVFPDLEKAASWAQENKKKIKSLQIFRLQDGRRVADFTPVSEKVLFQETDPHAVNREIASLEKRLGSMMPEAERIRLGKRLYELNQMRSGMEPVPVAAPEKGKVITLWTPEGERPIERSETRRETTAQSPGQLREVPHGLAPVPEPPGTGIIPERPEPSGVSATKPGAERTVRAGGEGSRRRATPGVVGGEPRESLPTVVPIRVADPARPKRPPIYADADWNTRVKLYRLPENAPTPTVAISNDLARMLMGGQRELVESALSGLDRYNSFILAAQTGTGKTYAASAVMHHMLEQNPDAYILIKTPSRTLIDKEGGYKQVSGDFGIDVEDLPVEGVPTQPGVYAVTWAASLNRDGIEKFPWDLVVADEIHEARRWFADSKRGQQMKEMANNAKNVLYMSATPFHTGLEIGHMDKLGLWKDEGYEQWAKQFGVYRDSDGNLAGGRAPLKLAKLRQQLIERGQYINLDRSMEGYSAHFGVVPMDGVTKQGLANIDKAMQLAENYWYQVNKPGKVRPTRAQAVTLKKRWLESQRLPQAIELGKKLENQGWKVIIFSENKKEFNELFEFLKEADEGTNGEISRLLPKFGNVTDKLQEHFGEDIGIFAGRQSAARDNEKTLFNDGTKKHVYATYGAGGVGVGFHDVTGRAPRAVIYLGPPWSGVAFDQALGRPWRYGTRSNVRAYFLFSNSQPEMDLVTNKVAPRMESLRAMVSGVKFEDPVVKALREIPENREALLDYEFGNEHTSQVQDFNKAADTKLVTSYSELPVVDAKEAMNKGMKLPGGEGASKPGVIKLFQAAEDDVLPDDLEAPELRRARTVNVSIADAFIDNGAAPGSGGVGRQFSPIERRRLADAIMMQADAAARDNPAGATQQVYTAWENGMKQADAFLSGGGGEGGMEPPPGGMEKPPDPEKPGPVKVANWYLFTNGRDVMREATKAAGTPEVGEALARGVAQYHIEGGNIAGPWVQKYWDILKDNKITKDEHHVLFLTMAGRQKARRWIDNELQRVRSETPMNERIARAADQIQDMLQSVFKRLQKDNIYTTVYDAESGTARRVYYADQTFGAGYVPQRYDYDAEHTVVDPKTGEKHTFTLRELTEKDPGEVKREAIISGMMENHGLSRSQAEDWLSTRKRRVPLVGHVERARESDIPFFRTDAEVITSYLEGAGELLSRKKYFGQEGEKVAGLLAKIPDKKARDITKEIMDSLLQRDPMADEPKAWLRLAADWSVLSKMTFSSVRVLGHPAHGAVLSNVRSFLGALFEGTVGYRDAVRLANLAGSTLEQTKIEMLSEYGIKKKGLASKFLQANLWQTAYKWGRVVSDANARVYMGRYALPELIRHPDNMRVRRQLTEFMLMDNKRIDSAIDRRHWTEDDMAWGAKAFADKVMFTFDPTELPPAWRARAGSGKPVADFGNSILRAATLLKGYQFKTHALLKDAIYDEIKNHGNFKPLLPFVTVYPLLGELIWNLTSLATANKKHFQQMMKDDFWEPGNLLKRYIEDIAHQIGDSQLMAAIEAFRRGNARLAGKITEEYFLGPDASDALRTLNTAGDVAFSKNNRHRQKAAENYIRETFPVAQPLMNLTQPAAGGMTMAPAPPR